MTTKLNKSISPLPALQAEGGKNSFLLLSLIVIALLTSCNSNEGKIDLTNFDSFTELQPEKTFSLNQKVSGNIRSLSANSDGIFIIYRNKPRIEFLDWGFNKIKIYESKGSGPGEFINPFRVEITEESVLVVDYDKLTIEVFDLELNYIKSIALNNRPWDILFNKQFGLIEVQVPSNGINIVVHNNDLSAIKNINIPIISTKPYENLGFSSFLNNNQLLYSFAYQNIHYIIDSYSGEIVKEFNFVSFPEKSPLIKIQNMEVPEYEFVKDIALNEFGLFILSGVVTKRGQPLFQIDSTGAITNEYLLSNAITVSSFFDNSLLGYSPDKEQFHLYRLKK